MSAWGKNGNIFWNRDHFRVDLGIIFRAGINFGGCTVLPIALPERDTCPFVLQVCERVGNLLFQYFKGHKMQQQQQQLNMSTKKG